MSKFKKRQPRTAGELREEPAGNHRGRSEDGFGALGEQLGELAEAEQDRRWQEWLRTNTGILRGVPPYCECWLREYFLAVEPRDSEANRLLQAVREHGLMRTLVQQIDNDDQERRRDAGLQPNLLPGDSLTPDGRRNLLPSKEQYSEILVEALKVEDDPKWRGRIVKWLPVYPPCGDLTTLLTELLHDKAGEARWFAAIHLARLAPETPGLVPTLVEALQSDWHAYTKRRSDFGANGSGEAAAALAKLDSLAGAAVSELQASVESHGDHCFDGAAALVAAGLISGQPAEAIWRLADEVRTLGGWPGCRFAPYFNAWRTMESAGIPALVAAEGLFPDVSDAATLVLESLIKECLGYYPEEEPIFRGAALATHCGHSRYFVPAKRDQNRYLVDDGNHFLQQLRNYPAWAAKTETIKNNYAEIAAKTPLQFHSWLRKFLTDQVMENPAAPRNGYVPGFLCNLRDLGLVRGILFNIDQDDCSSKELRRGASNRVPDRSIVWDFIRFAIDHEDDTRWRNVALKWVVEYAPDRKIAIELLTNAMRQGSAIAALRLSELAPDTPGLVDALSDALGHDWQASGHRSYSQGIGGAGMAAQALVRLGTATNQALGRLRDAVLSERRDWHSEVDRQQALWAFINLCENETEIRTTLEEVAAKESSIDGFLGPVTYLARRNPVFVATLSRLMQSRFWQEWPHSDELEWMESIDLMGQQARNSETILPALAAALQRFPKQNPASLVHQAVDIRVDARLDESPEENPSSQIPQARTAQAVTEFLKRLCENQSSSSQEDRFVLSLMGRAATDVIWLVYADWLEERADPRSDFLRLRHALASTDRLTDPSRFDELQSRYDAWLTAHGRGWAEIYEAVGRWGESGGIQDTQAETV